MEHPLNHERLDVYRLAVEVARWVADAQFPANMRALEDQAVRASQSIVLNIAEGASRRGQAGRNHFRIALGSVAETCAVLDLTALAGAEEQQAKLRRVGTMLYRLR
jgi:four helix bundle protein